jgi:hypothetical protein
LNGIGDKRDKKNQSILVQKKTSNAQRPTTNFQRRKEERAREDSNFKPSDPHGGG